MELSSEEYDRRRVESYNSSVGTLTGYNCPKCKNRGDFMRITEDGYEIFKECECMNIRRTIERVNGSGLKELMKNYTFDNYKTESAWQKRAKRLAMDFVKDHKGKWFYAGGQVGCGKTHLCTAIVGEFINSGKPAHYMLWRDEIVALKSNVTDEAVYGKNMKKLKESEVLYIDDFFKTEQGKMPTTADINIAFEILNYRYNDPKLITVISSEMLIDSIIKIDEAVGSRIFQRARDYCLSVGYDSSKNYRLNGNGSV